MNPIAVQLNKVIEEANPYVLEMLSEVGKKLFFPKGILSQSAEAKEKAHRFNATIGMAKEGGRPMYLTSIMEMISGLEPEEAITYAPSFGILPLRETWQKSLYRKNPSLEGKMISLPVVTNAITHGLSVAADLWVDPGDVVVLPDKMWGNYNMIFTVRKGAKLVNYPLFNQDGGFNLAGFREVLEQHCGERKKVIVILNFPNNPTGYSINRQEAEGICSILRGLADNGVNVVAITDEAYFGLFYDEEVMKESIFSMLMDIHPRVACVKLDGATKEDFVWGLRVGFITFGINTEDQESLRSIYDALEKKAAGAVRGSISNACHLSQEILLKAIQHVDYIKEKHQKYEIMKERAQEVKEVLSDPRYSEAWEVYPFNSGYFMCLKLKTVNAEALRVHLLEHYGVGLISIGDTDLRIAFSCIEKGEIKQLFDVILQGVGELEEGSV